MTRIQCLAGQTETNVAGTIYQFERDEHGRFVCDVHDRAHVRCFLAVKEHYCEAEELGSHVPVSPPVENPDPGSTDGEGGGEEDPGEGEGGNEGGHAGSPNPDDLTVINGIGPATAEKLAALGINTFAQIAAFNDEQVATLDSSLGLKNAIISKDWRGQAQALVDASTGGEGGGEED